MVNRPTFLAFETAKRAIANSQLGLDTVGHNISNVNTEGYTRQRVDQVSWSISGMTKFAVNKSFYPGMGAKATGISQIRDPYLDARYRDEASDFGELVVKQSGLTDIDKIFGEYSADAGLATGMSDLIEALRDSMKDTTGSTYNVTVQGAADTFAKNLNMYAKDLARTLDNHLEDVAVSIDDELNPILKELAVLNEQVMQMEVYGNPANELNDRRNLLLDELAGFVDIQITRDVTQLAPGVAVTKLTVSIPGSKDDFGDPIVLVDHDKSGAFSYARTETGELEIGYTDIDGIPVTPEAVDSSLNTGALRGYLDVINGDGLGGNPRGIQYANNYLNTLAVTFAQTMNAINTAQMKDTTTDPITYGNALLVNSTLVAPAVDPNADPDDEPAFDPAEGITAANIAISAAWAADENEIILGRPANGSYDTAPASQYINALEKGTYEIIPEQAATNFYDAIVNFQGTIGLDLSSVNNLLSTSNKVLTSIDDQRQSISGVSENEEAVNMMTYSNHYNAAVRYMTTIDEALNTIINNMGLVGR
jgi:flagellar hook-associated protein 1 FlgK